MFGVVPLHVLETPACPLESATQKPWPEQGRAPRKQDLTLYDS